MIFVGVASIFEGNLLVFYTFRKHLLMLFFYTKEKIFKAFFEFHGLRKPTNCKR